MSSQLEPPPLKMKTQRGLIRKWLLVVLVLALIWNVRGAVKSMPGAIRNLTPWFDSVPDSAPPGPIQTEAQPAAAVPDAAVPDKGVTASSSPPVRAEERPGAEPSGSSVIPNSERAGAPGYSVQVAAVPDLKEARTLSDKLTQAGYSVYLTTATVNQVRYNRVRVGPFQTWQAAQQVSQRLETQGYRDPWITK
jgi:cell division septation protein DedD